MENVIWGAEIEGPRPVWLKNGEVILPSWHEGSWYPYGAVDVVHTDHTPLRAFKLPADHPYYAGPSQAPSQAPTATEDAGPFVTVRQMTEKEMHKVMKANGWSTPAVLRSLGLIREETALDRYFAGKAVTTEERKAVEEYAAWMEENSK